MTQRPPDHHNIVEDAWSEVVGGVDWLKSVFIGEFADHRSLSALVVDMLLSFVPGVVIVTSARDAVAVILRLAHHPEKREELMEWVLLSACLIVIALPLAMAAGGAAAAGVGAIVGGIAGSELGAALRAVMLLLIKEATKLVEVVQFLQRFMKGDVLKFLRGVKFAKYEKALLLALNKMSGQLLEIVKSLRVHLESLRYFDAVKATIARLAEWENKFYDLQRDAFRQIPRALAELDARLAKVLAQTAPKEVHTVAAGVSADKSVAAVPAKQLVKDAPGNVFASAADEVASSSRKLASHGGDKAQGHAHPALNAKAGDTPKSAPVEPPKGKPEPSKNKPEPPKLQGQEANTKRQTIGDATVGADRERIAELAKKGEVRKAQDILQPYVDRAMHSTDVAERDSLMQSIIDRLDVSSDKEKMFWSGDKDVAAKVALDSGKTILEQTAGGRVIDGWDDINKAFPWDDKKIGPHGWDFWGAVSSKYSKDAIGEIDIIQNGKKFPAGGDIWRGYEWPAIKDEEHVRMMNIFEVGKDGDVLRKLRIAPNSIGANYLFGKEI